MQSVVGQTLKRGGECGQISIIILHVPNKPWSAFNRPDLCMC